MLTAMGSYAWSRWIKTDKIEILFSPNSIPLTDWNEKSKDPCKKSNKFLFYFILFSILFSILFYLIFILF